MKINNVIFWALGLAVAATSCAINEPIDGSELPEGAYIRLNFSSDAVSTAQENVTKAAWSDSKGSGNLTFNWEAVAIDSDETSKLAFIVTDGTNPISVKASSEAEISTYSGLSVTPREGNNHYATFQTVGYYATSDLRTAKYCFAASGNPSVTANSKNGNHLCQFPSIPSTFTQIVDQDPSFLREYMQMYSTTPYSGNGNTLTFKHIPATFRFVVTNATSNPVQLQEVFMSLSHISGQSASSSVDIQDWNDSSMDVLQMAVSEGGNIASESCAVTFDWSDGTAAVAYGQNGHESITVKTGNSTSVAAGEKYIAYAMALPLSDNNAFKDKTLNVSIKTGGFEQIAFQLTGSKLAEINGANVYNWISGKSYTIRINIGSDGKVTGEILDGNVIKVTSNVAESYTLKYEGADGKPLEDYAPICTLPGERTVEEYRDLIAENIAPRDAETIGIYDSEGMRKGTILISDLKPDFSEVPMYSFGLLSDVHVGRSGINAEQDFENVLDFFQSKGTTMTCICGDITQDGTEAQFSAYKEIIVDEPTNVYTTTGNHDCTGSHQGIDGTLWQKYTGLPLVFEKTIEMNGQVDHYLFLGMSYWNFGAAYLDYHINWLEDKLEAYRNERCFVITHLFFPDRAGNMNGIYTSSNWLTGSQLTRLQDMCDHYVNSIWISGHSHWEWSAQQHQDRANIYRTYNGSTPASGWCLHVPACGAPATSSTGNDRGENGAGSEGAVVEVYENHIDILGIAVDASGAYKYQPIATYRLDTTPQEVAVQDIERESHYLKAEHFHAYKGEGEFSVTDVEDMPNYIDVVFSAPSQGWYVRNETFLKGVSNSVSITIEDIMCWTNWDSSTNTGDRQYTPIDYVGFYSGEYNLTSTNACYVNSTNGVQFQTSSKCVGPFKVKLRMKVQMVFSPSSSGEDGGGVESDGDYVKATDFVQYKGESGKHPVVQLDDNYVQVTFNSYDSSTVPGFFVANSTYVSNANKVSIIVEDVEAYDASGNVIDMPAGVGFWCTNSKYLMSSTTTAIVNNNYKNGDKIYWGVQFQISNSQYGDGPIPLTLKMKVRMQFYGDNGGSSGGDSGEGGDQEVSEYIRAKHFSLNTSKNKDESKQKPTVVDVADDDYIDVTFYGVSQGFFITPDNFPGKGGKVNITLEDAYLLYSDGSISTDLPSKVGFYGKPIDADGYNYYLKSLTMFNDQESGVCFQTSSSSSPSGGWPITIRMKAKMEFTD